MQLEPVVAKLTFVLDTPALNKSIEEAKKITEWFLKWLKLDFPIDTENIKSKTKHIWDMITKVNEQVWKKQKIDIDYNFDEKKLRQDLEKWLQWVKMFARDTKKEIDNTKFIEIQVWVAKANAKLMELRQEMKKTTDWQKIAELKLNTVNAQSQLTEMQRKLQNLKNTWDESMSRLNAKFIKLWETISWAVSWLWEKLSWLFWGTWWAVWWAISEISSWLWWVASKAWPIWVAVWAIATAAGAAWWAMVALWDKLQQATISFTTMLWSASEAKNFLQELSDFASKTPFEISGLRDTAKQLLAFWVEQEKVIPTLKSLWDVAAWLSVPIEQIAYAYWQVRSANQLYGTELRQFVNAWVPLLAELSDMYGVNEAEMKKMVEAWKIWFADVEKAFENMSSGGGRFTNLMQQQSTTLSGTISNIKDSFTLLWESIGTALLPWMQSVANWLSSFVNFLRWESIPASNELATAMDASSIYTQKLYWEVSILDAEMEKLTQEYNAWTVWLEDYIAQQAKLQIQKEELTAKIEQEKDRIRELNEAMTESQAEQAKIEEKMISYQKELDSLSWKQNVDIEEKKSLESGMQRLVIMLEEQKQKQAELKDEMNKWIDTQARYELWLKKVWEAESKLNWIIDSLKTARTQKEFDDLKAKKIEQIHTNALLIKSEFDLQRIAFKAWKISESQYTEFWKSAIDALNNLKKLEAEAKKVSFVAPTAGWDKKKGWGWKSEAEKASEEEKKLQEKIIADNRKRELDLLKEEQNNLIKKRDETKKNQEEIQKAKFDIVKDRSEKEKKQQEEVIKNTEKVIEDSKEKVKWYYEDIANSSKKLQETLANINKEESKSITDRVVEIDKSLASKDTTPEEKIKLEAERSKAYIGLTQEEIVALDAKIQKQKEYDALSWIEKIKVDFEEKRALAIAENAAFVAETQAKIDEETRLQEAKTAELAKYEEVLKLFTAKYDTYIDKQVQAQQRLQQALKDSIALQAQLNSMTWWGTSTPTTTTSTTNNKTVVNNVQVSSNVDANAFTSKLRAV